MNELDNLKPEVAAQAYSMEAIRGAVARGWCAPVNERKVMDADLAEAIAREVSAMLAAAPQPQAAEPVAWMHPELHEGHPYPEECLTTEAIDGWLPLYTHPQPAQDAALRSANATRQSQWRQVMKSASCVPYRRHPMSDTDKLRPEVQVAIRTMSGEAAGNRDDAYEVIEAELLRLTEENARLSGHLCLVCGLPNDSQCPQRNDEMSPCTFDPSPIDAAKTFLARATQAESELAALKARIAEAPITQVTRMAAIGGGGYEWAGCRVPDAWNGKHVRLVVEE